LGKAFLVYIFEEIYFMPYNKEELMALPPKEKLQLAEELWGSVENEMIAQDTEEEAFATERLRLHNKNPNENIDLEGFKTYFKQKYGY